MAQSSGVMRAKADHHQLEPLRRRDRSPLASRNNGRPVVDVDRNRRVSLSPPPRQFPSASTTLDSTLKRSPQKSARTETESRRQKIPVHLLERLASEILDHTKELGLFDEMRIKLLDDIESSKGYYKIKGEFKREMENFCSKVDLCLPRSKLREKLSTKTLHKSAGLLEEHVAQVTRKNRQELKQLYNKHAFQFLRTNQTTGDVDGSQQTYIEIVRELHEPNQQSGKSSTLSFSSQSDSTTDSGVSSSISPQNSATSPSLQPKTDRHIEKQKATSVPDPIDATSGVLRQFGCRKRKKKKSKKNRNKKRRYNGRIVTHTKESLVNKNAENERHYSQFGEAMPRDHRLRLDRHTKSQADYRSKLGSRTSTSPSSSQMRLRSVPVQRSSRHPSRGSSPMPTRTSSITSKVNSKS